MTSNIRKLYVLNFLCGLVFWYPIEKLFLESIGVGPFGISINAIVFLTVMVAFDVPAGVLADGWKRKHVLVLACLSLLLASLIAGSSHSLPIYLVATALVGGYMVLTSGTSQAMMYDSLKDSGNEKAYDKHQGRAFALYLAGFGLSSIIGGYIAHGFGYRASYFVTAAAMVLALLVAATLVEPQTHKVAADHKLRAHVSASVRQVFASRLLLQLSLLIVAATTLRSSQNEYAPLLFLALGLSAVPIGYATVAKWLTSSLGQIAAPRLGRRTLKLTPLFFVAFALFSLIRNDWSFVFFYAASFLFSAITNQAEAAVQDVTPSELRATMLSVLNFSGNILLIPLSLLFGWIAQHSNVFNGYRMIAIVGVLYLAAWFISGRKSFHAAYNITPHHAQAPSIDAELV